MIPFSITTPLSPIFATGNSFLLLNNEFKIDAYLTGFELYSTIPGEITLTVRQIRSMFCLFKNLKIILCSSSTNLVNVVVKNCYVRAILMLIQVFRALLHLIKHQLLWYLDTIHSFTRLQ